MLVVLLPADEELSIGPDTAARLAELGVTIVSVVRDEQSLGLVLDGWGFDPDRSGPEALAALGRSGHGRLLPAVVHLALPLKDAAREPWAATTETARATALGS